MSSILPDRLVKPSRMLNRTLRGAALMAFAVCLSAPRQARATLGGDVASVAANESHLRAARHVERFAKGERHDLVLPSGVVVREYVSPAGVVYAVTWSGPRIPNLEELIGPYFAQLSGPRPSAGHHRLRVGGADFRLQSSGHERSFAGRAWVPSQLPSGVDIDALPEP